jgi:hypothetical protein
MDMTPYAYTLSCLLLLVNTRHKDGTASDTIRAARAAHGANCRSVTSRLSRRTLDPSQSNRVSRTLSLGHRF